MRDTSTFISGRAAQLARTGVVTVTRLSWSAASSVVETSTALVTLGGAVASTFTTSLSVVLAPGPSGPRLVHETVCPVAVQLQPVPEAELYLRPVGRVSRTVMA